MTTQPHELASLLIALGVAGVELAAHPTDRTRVRHRPATLALDLATPLKRHRDAIAALLNDGYSPADPDVRQVLGERLGIADDLGMPTHPGSPAGLIAVGESLTVSSANAGTVGLAGASNQNTLQQRPRAQERTVTDGKYVTR